MSRTHQRVRLADGRYCYSGPNCKWHSPAGIHSARKALDKAVEKAVQAETYEEFTEAQEELKAANEQYDATTEGVEKLRKAISESENEMEAAPLKTRLDTARATLEEVEREQQRAWEETRTGVDLNNFTRFDHTYEEPTFKVVDSRDNPFPAQVGSNYDPELTPAQTASALRRELKTAQEHNYLPSDVEYKVIKTGNQSYQVSLRGIHDTGGRGGWTPDVKELLARTRLISNSFTYDASAAQVDHYQRSLTIYPKVETAEDREDREREESRKAERARLAPLIRNLKSREYRSDVSFSDSNTLADGRKFSRVNNEESIIAVLSQDGNRVRYFDLRDKVAYNRETRRYEKIQSDPSRYSFSELKKHIIKQ